MKYLIGFFSLAFFFSSCVKDRDLTSPPPVTPGGTVIDYWNFNGSSLLDPTTGNGSLNVPDTYDDIASTASSINAQNGDADGNALRVRNPSTAFVIEAPTTGYKNIKVSYAVEASSASNAALINSVSYTIDGTTYITTGLPASATYSLANVIDPAYTLESFDFSSITGVNDNPDFKVKITFSNGNTNTSGNDRFDNITVTGDAISNPGGGNAPSISSAATTSATVGTTFTYNITASNSPSSYNSTGLPTGLTINTTTGVISGTPTVTGSFTVTLSATNASGTGTQTLTIGISQVSVLALIHYWNFNGSTLTDPNVGNGSLTIPETYDDVTSTASSINAQNGDADGNALRVRNPSTFIVMSVPTTGYKNIVVSYAVEASSTTNAALTNTVSYTTDGTSYVTTGLPGSATYDLTNVIDPLYVLKTFDFSSIPAVNNNPNFKVKITFSNGNANSSGNNRFDNITVQGYAQ